jgi:UPF0755 protein
MNSLPAVKVKFKDLLSRKETIFVIVFFLAVLSVLYYIYFTPNYFEGKSPQNFEIGYGENLSEIAEKLFNRGIIKSKFNFRVASFIMGADRKIKAARYQIPNGLSYVGLIDFFLNADADFLIQIKINNGQTIKWLASKLKREAKIDSTEFVLKANDRNLVKSFNIDAGSLEGYLFASRYYIFQRSKPEDILKIFVERTFKFFSDTLLRKVEEKGFNIHKVLTLASIVKGETDLVEEMPVISQVYLNRLKIGMRLQADPTIQYILPEGWRKLYYKDLKINSPYNTYLYSGLPPGPINSPGKDAILSVIYPKKHKYLFFVADGNGKHKFAETHIKHLENVKEYRKWIEKNQ